MGRQRAQRPSSGLGPLPFLHRTHCPGQGAEAMAPKPNRCSSNGHRYPAPQSLLTPLAHPGLPHPHPTPTGQAQALERKLLSL